MFNRGSWKKFAVDTISPHVTTVAFEQMLLSLTAMWAVSKEPSDTSPLRQNRGKAAIESKE